MDSSAILDGVQWTWRILIDLDGCKPVEVPIDYWGGIEIFFGSFGSFTEAH